MEKQRIAVVTGGNRGIGYEIVRGLCEEYIGLVYLTARDLSSRDITTLAIKYANFKCHQLDITDQSSVDDFRDLIKKRHGELNLLVNNAGIAYKQNCTIPFAVQANETIRVNYFGTLKVCEALFPLLAKNGVVVTVTGSAGFLKRIPSETLRKQFSDPNLTVDAVTALMKKFVSDARVGNHKKEGWGKSAYVVSKVGLSALTIAQQLAFNFEKPYRNIRINHVHPGFVKTHLTSGKGVMTPAEGAKSALFAALDADYRGQFVWHDCRAVDWYGDKHPFVAGV